MKTTDELFEEVEKADQAFDQCRARLRAAICKDPEYLRTLATCDAAFAAYAKSRGIASPPHGWTAGEAEGRIPFPRPAVISQVKTRISTIF